MSGPGATARLVEGAAAARPCLCRCSHEDTGTPHTPARLQPRPSGPAAPRALLASAWLRLWQQTRKKGLTLMATNPSSAQPAGPLPRPQRSFIGAARRAPAARAESAPRPGMCGAPGPPSPPLQKKKLRMFMPVLWTYAAKIARPAPAPSTAAATLSPLRSFASFTWGSA
jgi:hypothetical protein